MQRHDALDSHDELAVPSALRGIGMTAPQVTDDLLARMTSAIVATASPEAVVLFGSCAKGCAGQDSDVDFLVIQSGEYGPERRRHSEAVRILRALAPLLVPADVLVYTRSEVERWRGSLNHVVGRALREGRVLYGRA
jgi:predicted nucleotidyltransferase